jgi:hypothetical protein
MRRRKKPESVASRIFVPTKTGPHESVLRSMIAESGGKPYHAVESLEQVKRDPNGVVIFQGDDGGQIYLVCPASTVKCSEQVLQGLLGDLDSRAWKDISMARICYEILPPGSSVADGMGGGVVADGVWLHHEFMEMGLRSAVCEVLEGKRPAI